MKYLTTANAKTPKGEKHGFLTGILYLAPGDLSGTPLCPNASPGCLAGCLYTAGRGALPSVHQARLARSHAFLDDPMEFLRQLSFDIMELKVEAQRKGLGLVIRLNGTSDIAWERLNLDGHSLPERFPETIFYDYTKSPARALQFLSGKDWPANYHLVFSRSETNEYDVQRVMRAGGSAAVVFDTGANAALPAYWHGYSVTDGDEHDLRFRQARGHLIGLRAKGAARKDTLGFTVPVRDSLEFAAPDARLSA